MSNKQIALTGLVVSLLALMITCGQLTVEVAALLAQTNRPQVPVIIPVPVLMNTPLTPTDTPSPMLTATPLQNLEVARLVIDYPTLSVHSGPGTNYPVIGRAYNGEHYDVTGKNMQGTWYQIAFDGQLGWVADEFVTLEGNPGAVQLSIIIIPSLAVTPTQFLMQTVISVRPSPQVPVLPVRAEPYIVFLLLATVVASVNVVFFLRNWIRLK